MKEKKNPAEENAENKMTIYEYEQKFVKRENLRGAKLFLTIIAAAVGIFIAVCLLTLTLKLWDIHMYAGIAAAAVSVLLFILLFVVPLVKIVKAPHFEVNVNARTAAAAKKHNRRVRHEIACKMIDLTAKVQGVGWYSSEEVGAVAIAERAGDEKALMQALTALYKGSVKKSAKDLILKSAVRSGMYSAVSQTNKVDALLVAFIDIQLVKDLVFLYGFRPSDAKLAKIFARVLQNSLIAYGLGGVRIGNTIVKTMGDAVKGIPLLGSAISAVVDSSVQGLTNGVLTAVMGYQTIKYLNDEYRLQEILDGVELADEGEFEETVEEVEEELRGGKAKRKVPQAG